MAIRAFAIANDLGVLFLDHQLLVFPRRIDAKRKLAALDARATGGLGYFDEARIETVQIDRRSRSRDKAAR